MRALLHKYCPEPEQTGPTLVKKSCRIGVKILTTLQDCAGFLYVIVQDFLTLHGTLQGVLHGIL